MGPINIMQTTVRGMSESDVATPGCTENLRPARLLRPGSGVGLHCMANPVFIMTFGICDTGRLLGAQGDFPV